MKIQKHTNLAYVFFICSIFTLFINCAGMDTPIEYASQSENEQGTHTTTYTNNPPLGEFYNNYNNIVFNQRNENTPNMKRIIDRLARQCPVIMQSVWSESQRNWSGDLRFLDLAVEALQAEDQRWGYTFWTRTGRPDSWSVDRVGYFHGTGDPQNSTDMTVIDYLAPRQENGKQVYYSSWYDATEQLKTEYPDATGYWRRTRPGATVSLSDCSNSGGGTSPTTTTTTHPNTRLGQCDVPNRFSVVKKVARDYPELLAKSANREAKNWEFLEKLVEELRKTDTKWGFYHRTQHNLQRAALDAIAYYCGTGNGNGSSDLRFVDVISSARRPRWGDTGHEDRARPENGYWKYPRAGGTTTTQRPVVRARCGNQPNTCTAGDFHPHPKDTLKKFRWTCRNQPHRGEKRCSTPRTVQNCNHDPHFKVVNGQCLPSCGGLAFYRGQVKHQLQSGQCRSGWTRLGNSYEEANGDGICCTTREVSSNTQDNVNLDAIKKALSKTIYQIN